MWWKRKRRTALTLGLELLLVAMMPQIQQSQAFLTASSTSTRVLDVQQRSFSMTCSLSSSKSVTAAAAAAAAAAEAAQQQPQQQPQQQSFQAHAEDCLAQSLLIFLLADLRRLSTQGRIHTPFQVLSVASDDAVRNTADRWSCAPHAFPELVSGKNPGLSAAHVMAALLVETRRAVLEQRRMQDKENDGPTTGTTTTSSIEEPSILEALAKSDDQTSLLDDLDTNLQSYTTQLLRDLKGTPDKDETELFSTMTRKRRDATTSSSTSSSTWMFSSSGAASMADNVAKMNDHLTQFGVLGDKLFALGSQQSGSGVEDDPAMSEDELLDYMQQALETREDGRLDFMSALFKDDSTSQLAVQSRARVVWMNDWHPTSDLLYAVSVNKELRQVTIVFRGAQNEADFNTCKDTELIQVPNPVQEDYTNKTDTIQVHAGFYKYLFRRRKDTGVCKYDEIVNIMTECANRIGQDSYKVVVTGLSLGAALSNVFSLFASADERFRRNGPLQVFTFGGPMTAGRTMADAFHHQEVTRKLQLARFYNVRDCITHFPPNPDGLYKHCGITIKLHRPRPRQLWDVLGPVEKPEVSYDFLFSTAPDNEHVKLAWPNLFWFNLPLPWNIINVHLLPEHQRRSLLARAVSRDDEDSEDKTTLDDLYQTFVYSKYGKDDN